MEDGMECLDRFKVLEARCSVFAADLLSQLENHPSLPELLSLLEQIDGQLYHSDIEFALLTLRKAMPR